ncbi:MAG: cache domain-containing protein [Bacteroidota bacterium]
MKTKLFLLITAIVFAVSCNNDDETTPSLTNEQRVAAALDVFVADLKATPPTSADISNRVRQYLNSQPSYFFGSTVTLLDSDEQATDSPYWYRSGDSLLSSDLMDSAYHINAQLWLRQPIDSGFAIWTDPYFDAGGGNINMKTRSVPVIVNGRIIAVATTDLAL